MKEKTEYQLPLVTVIYCNNDIVTASNIFDTDDETVTDQDWGI